MTEAVAVRTGVVVAVVLAPFVVAIGGLGSIAVGPR
jgi:hypothetical protein